MKMRVTVTFEYEADPPNYGGAAGDAAAMAAIDTDNFINDPGALESVLMDAAENEGYDVLVEPVK